VPNDIEWPRPPPSRAWEFAKGFVSPLPFAIVGLATYPLFASYNWKHHERDDGSAAVPLAAALTIVAAVVLVGRWRTRAPLRAYGVIVGTLTLPITLALLFFACVLAFDIQLMPR